MKDPRAVGRRILRWFVVIGFVGGLAGPASADMRHHIAIGLGYAKMLSSDFKDDTRGTDLTNAANGVVAYRFSFNPKVDLTIDSRGFASTDSYSNPLTGSWDYLAATSFFGPGIRWNVTGGTAKAYLQGNVFTVSEYTEAKQGSLKNTTSDNGAGFGLMGGVDLRLSDLLSFPIEVNYLYSKPADDVSGIGFTFGLTFNFGQMP